MLTDINVRGNLPYIDIHQCESWNHVTRATCPQRQRHQCRGRVLQQALRHRAGQTSPWVRELAIADPPLKLVLLEHPGRGGSLNHLGVEVEDVDTVDATQTRLAAEGLASIDERGTTCCYAKQDKFWVQGSSDGERWEVYTVLADSVTFNAADDGGPDCCGADAASEEHPASATCC